jgi:hypothetical protein
MPKQSDGHNNCEAGHSPERTSDPQKDRWQAKPHEYRSKRSDAAGLPSDGKTSILAGKRGARHARKTVTQESV